MLEENTTALLGDPTLGRRVRIMMTMPSEAADNYDMVKNLLQNGMNCARMNRAHDSPEVWERMVLRVKITAVEVCVDDYATWPAADCIVNVISALMYWNIFTYTSPPNPLELQPSLESVGGGFWKKKFVFDKRYCFYALFDFSRTAEMFGISRYAPTCIARVLHG